MTAEEFYKWAGVEPKPLGEILLHEPLLTREMLIRFIYRYIKHKKRPKLHSKRKIFSKRKKLTSKVYAPRLRLICPELGLY